MSTHRIDPRAGFVAPEDLARGARGWPLCRWCGNEVEPPRRTFCSDPCLHEHLVRTRPGYARQCVQARDQGVCRLCGRDTTPLAEIFRWAKFHYDELFACLNFLKYWGGPWFERRIYSHFFHQDLAALIGVTRTGTAWEMDHVVPVIEGGGSCGLDNLRTLCIPCHREVTRDLRWRLGTARNTEQQARRTGPNPRRRADPAKKERAATEALQIQLPAGFTWP